MSNKKSNLIITGILLTLTLALTACSGNGSTGPTPTPDSGTQAPTEAANPTDTTDPAATTAPTSAPEPTSTGTAPVTELTGLTAEFTNFDKNTSYDALNPAITLNGTTASFTGEGMVLNGNVLTINKEGTYVVSGTAGDLQLYVNVTDAEKVHLVLNNANLTCTFGPAIYIANADKVSITLAEGTVNTLADGSSYALAADDKANSCIYSKDDLSINGSGSLTVTGNYNNGIDTSNDLRIVGGTITVTAKNHAVKGNDSIAISGGTVTVKAGSDGFKADTEGEADKGYFYMTGGTLDVTASDDGIQAVTSILVTGGTISFHVIDDKTNCDGTTAIAEGVIK